MSPGDRRQSILDAARAVAVQDGLVALTLKSVGARAGVVPSLVAHYFPAMNDLVIETFRSLAGDELATLLRIQAGQSSDLERMRTLVNWLQGPERLEVTAAWLDAILIGRRNGPLAAEIRRQLDDWQAAVTSLIRHGVASAEFVCERPEIVAAHLLSLIDGLNTNSLVDYHDSAGLGDYLRELVEGELHLERGALSSRQAGVR